MLDITQLVRRTIWKFWLKPHRFKFVEHYQVKIEKHEHVYDGKQVLIEGNNHIHALNKSMYAWTSARKSVIWYKGHWRGEITYIKDTFLENGKTLSLPFVINMIWFEFSHVHLSTCNKASFAKTEAATPPLLVWCLCTVPVTDRSSLQFSMSVNVSGYQLLCTIKPSLLNSGLHGIAIKTFVCCA